MSWEEQELERMAEAEEERRYWARQLERELERDMYSLVDDNEE